MSTFDAIARRVIVEANLRESGITSAYILASWLSARYRQVIDNIPFGNINRKAISIIPTTQAISSPGTVTIAQGTSQVIGNGTSFDLTMVGKWFRAGVVRGWMQILAVVGQQLTLDAIFTDTTRVNSSYFIAQRYYTLPTNIRWITDVINISRSLPMLYVTEAKLREMFPDRVSNPAVPQYACPVGFDSTSGRRVVEIYPFADTLYRIELSGYGNVDEPTLQSSPITDVNDQVLMEGCLEDAFRFRASLIADTNPQGALALLTIARSHGNDFQAKLDELATRDHADDKRPKVTLMIQRQDKYGIWDPLTTAEDEVWQRAPKIG